MDLCEKNIEISKEVFGFIENVPNVNEESITDYLVWKWREADKNFSYINVDKFLRAEESSMSGADFKMELWIVKNEYSISLVIQAKKLIENYDRYCFKLNYPNGGQGQLNKLLNYANRYKRLPFYMFYSVPDSDTRTMCGNDSYSQLQKCSIFLMDAFETKNLADTFRNRKLSKNQILGRSNPFHCLFCCPFNVEGAIGNYLERYYKTLYDQVKKWEIEYSEDNLPEYVQMILSTEFDEFRMSAMIREYNLNVLHKVAVYDMRNIR